MLNVTMEARPLQVVPSSPNNSSGEGGCGPHKEIGMGQRVEGVDGVVEMKSVGGVVKEEKSSSSFELDLGVGANYTATKPEAESEAALKPVITACNNRCCYLFTDAQRCELDHQVLIFKHFASNLPLPPHHLLVVPFFNRASSGAGTLGSGFGNFYKQFPTYMSEYSSQGFYHGNMVDPELHRCRRTDGKKWRCGKTVVPTQKYCERHMHRGRNRSRKPVETSEVNSPLITKPCSKLHNKASNTESSVSSPNPLSIRSAETSFCTASRSLAVANALYTNNRLKSVVDSSDYNTLVAADNRSSRNICHRDNLTKSCTGNNGGVRSGGKGSITCDSNCISTGIGFSPRSVLQGNIVSGCNNPYLNDRNSAELEPGRCRRTDGKKWRCKSAVLPGQKYCATHMHRGAKRRFADHEPATTTATTFGVTDARSRHSTAATTNIQKARCAIPSTNLSMSIPESEPLTQPNKESPSRSSDTDTTITDTMNEYSCASI